MHRPGCPSVFRRHQDHTNLSRVLRVWRWQDYSDHPQRFATRDHWYARHGAREEVLTPLEAALRWMNVQPELQ